MAGLRLPRAADPPQATGAETKVHVAFRTLISTIIMRAWRPSTRLLRRRMTRRSSTSKAPTEAVRTPRSGGNSPLCPSLRQGLIGWDLMLARRTIRVVRERERKRERERERERERKREKCS